MTRMPKNLMILFLAVISFSAKAQYTQELYYMNLPQNHLLNPALRPSNSTYVGLPAISGISIKMSNNFINFSDIFIKGQSDSLYSFLNSKEEADNFLSKINDKNSFEPELTVPLLGLGFTAGKDTYIFLDINDRLNGNVVLPGDIIKLALNGNEQFVGSKLDLSSLRGSIIYYREAGFGISKNFSNKLRLGIKGKLLFGIATTSLDNKSLGIKVNDDYTHTIDADLTLNFSAPMTVYRKADNTIERIVSDKSSFDTFSEKLGFISNTKNFGLGFDLGATYDINDKITVSAAITDLGFIKWKTDVNNLQVKGSFDFSGLNMLNVINNTMTFDSLANEMLDSLKNTFVVNASETPFATYLPSRITFGGSYNLTKSLSVGLLSCTRIIEKQIRESLTLSANVNLTNVFSVSLAYTAANKRYDNLGAGIAFRAGFFQFYLVADRIPFTWNKIIVGNNTNTADNASIVVPTNWNTISARIGFNLVFGNKPGKKSDKPMVIVE
jgi:hypothetical protein